MKDRITYYGPINNTYRQNLIRKAKYYLKENKGDKFYYLLPSGNLLTKYRRELLEGLKGVFDINVITFDDIVKDLIEKDMYIKIDDSGKETIISNIVNELYSENKLVYYKNMVNKDGFIKSISYIIGEIKRSLVTPQKYLDKSSNGDKLMEMGLIYDRYQQFLNNNNLLDREEEYIKSLEKLNDSMDLFGDLDFIIIDEFFDFRPQEVRILEKLSKLDMDIYVNMPYKTKQQYKTVNDTIDKLKEIGFIIEEINTNKESYFEELSNNIFQNNNTTYDKSDNINLIKAPNKNLELKKVAEEIKRLTNDGMRKPSNELEATKCVKLNEIGIIMGNIDNYRELLIKTFSDEGIPISLNEEIRLIDTPLVGEILNLIELRLNNYKKNNIINAIKSNYLDIADGIDRDRLEYILHSLKVGDKNNELYKSLQDEKRRLRYFINNKEDKEAYEEKLQNIVDLEFVIFDSLKEEIDKIPKKASGEVYKDTLLDLLKYYDAEDSIKNIYKYSNDYSILYRDLSVLSKIKHAFDNVINIINIAYNEEITLKEYYDIMVRLFTDETIIINSGNRDGVNILTPSTSRGLRFKEVFFIGLIEGEYPKSSMNNWFFREEENDVFKEIGIDIKSYFETMDKESLLFNIALTRATEKLYLSYPINNLNGEVTIPSMFLEELSGLFYGENLQDRFNTIIVTMDYLIKDNFHELTNKKDFVRSMLMKYMNEEDEKYLAILKEKDGEILEELIEKIYCEIKRDEKRFNDYDGFINDKEIKEELHSIYNNMKFSITQLETYGKCPFRFLYENILKVLGIDKEIEEFSALERGSVYHEVLAIYYENHRDDIRGYILDNKEFNIKETKGEITKLLTEAIEYLGINIDNRYWKLKISHMTNVLINLIEKDIDRLKGYKVNLLPHEFEVRFGYEEDFIVSMDKREVKLLGKIDRIDITEDENEHMVYDYKHSSYGRKSIKDITNGTSLQLPVYIMSQMDKKREVIAGGYLIIKDGNNHIELIKKEKKSYVGKSRGNGILTDGDWDKLLEEVKTKIGNYVDGIYKGRFALNPVVCDDYCPLKNMCRYNQERINRKVETYETNR
ncbi:PD-(D/E)XK nuclease family protein [Dethiothermospora halolimnae]|uniref:PD-(D/E)XK nuclease family protein n=1 Tax=Dethiothermospora halolimnae TaxID=3114390 RepID=UPI003CCBC61E